MKGNGVKVGENSVARDALLVFAGNASRGLAAAICQHLDVALGHAEVRQFSDGETQVEIHDNVRGGDVFVVQSTSTPGNDHIMELLLLLDALKRASAKRVTAVIPYYGYARQDRKVAPRVPISAKLVADLLETAGASRVMTLELHAGQIQGFFNVPVDNLYSNPVLLPSIFEELKGTGNWEVRLTRQLANKRVFPAIDIENSGTRKEELLMEPAEASMVWKLRGVLHALDPNAAIELLIAKLKETRSNTEFLEAMRKNSR